MPFTDKDKNKLFSEIRRISDKVVSCGQGTTNTEFDHTLLCGAGNVIVISVVAYSAAGVPTISYYNLDGTPYVGPQPTRCSDTLESDAQIICVSGNTELLQWIVKDNGQPTGTVYYTDLSGTIVAAPAPGTFSFGSCSLDQQIFQRCLCDDVNGDQSLIVNYIEFYTYDPSTNSITVTGYWDQDLLNPYVPVNPINCSTIGTATQLVQRRVHLTGAQVWNRPNTVVSMTIFVRRIGDVTNPATITDNAAVITPLFIGDNITYGIINDNNTLLQGTFSITMMDVDDIITINYLELI